MYPKSNSYVSQLKIKNFIKFSKFKFKANSLYSTNIWIFSGVAYIYIYTYTQCTRILVFARSLSRTGRIQIDLHAFFSFECKRLAPPPSTAHHTGYTYFLFDEARLSQDTKWPTDRILAPVQVRLGIRGNIVPRSYCVNGIICPRGWHDCIAPITVTVRSPLEKFPIRFSSNRSFHLVPSAWNFWKDRGLDREEYCSEKCVVW